MGIDIETIFDLAESDDSLLQSTSNLTESFNRLKLLIDEAKNQIQKEKTDFAVKLLENKYLNS